MAYEHNFPQRSPEWRNARLGRLTASCAEKIITPDGKRTRNDTWNGHLYTLIFERLCGESLDRDVSNIKAVQNGVVNEPVARKRFREETGLSVRQVGCFTDQPRIEDSVMLASPDGVIIGRNESLEIKCPGGKMQIQYLLENTADKYRPQVQFQMLVGGWTRVHFYSWHALTPAFYQIWPAEPLYQSELCKRVDEFIGKLEIETERCRRLGTFYVKEVLADLAETIEIEDEA